jgi:hypothetical protein
LIFSKREVVFGMKQFTEVEDIQHEHEAEPMLTPKHVRNFCQICQQPIYWLEQWLHHNGK